MNSEYYPGWLTHWQEVDEKIINLIVSFLNEIILGNATC